MTDRFSSSSISSQVPTNEQNPNPLLGLNSNLNTIPNFAFRAQANFDAGDAFGLNAGVNLGNPLTDNQFFMPIIGKGIQKLLKINYEDIVRETDNHCTGTGCHIWSQTWVGLTLISVFHHLAQPLPPNSNQPK